MAKRRARGAGGLRKRGDGRWKGRYTTGEWLRTWFEVYSKPNLREATQDQYTNFLEKHLIPDIGDIPLEKLTSLRRNTMCCLCSIWN